MKKAQSARIKKLVSVARKYKIDPEDRLSNYHNYFRAFAFSFLEGK